MAAAGIGPKACAMIFFKRPALEKQLTFRIEDENTKSPVKQPISMSLHLSSQANRLILFIYQHYLLFHDLLFSVIMANLLKAGTPFSMVLII
jgi:hypothetical protein